METRLSFIRLAFLLCFLTPLCSSHSLPHECKRYNQGDPIYFQCKNETTGEWGSPPQCYALDEEMHFLYGVDHFIHCQWLIESETQYQFFRRLIDREETWNCRVAVVPEHQAYIPFSLPIWGVVESDHIHVDIHINFVFHAYLGTIVGAAAYPIRDKFMFVKQGSILPIHGAVKWFDGHSFHDYYRNTPFSTGKDFDPYFAIVLMWSFILFSLTLFLLTFIYRRHLKPKLWRTVLKNE